MNTAHPPHIRRTVTLAVPQDAFLVAESARLGISVSDLVRRVVDHYLATRPAVWRATGAGKSEAEADGMAG